MLCQCNQPSRLRCYAWPPLATASLVLSSQQASLGWTVQERRCSTGPSEAGPSGEGPSGASTGEALGAASTVASAGEALAPGPAAGAAAGAAAAAPVANYPPAHATHEEVLADQERFSATWREALAALSINLDKVSPAGLLNALILRHEASRVPVRP